MLSLKTKGGTSRSRMHSFNIDSPSASSVCCSDYFSAVSEIIISCCSIYRPAAISSPVTFTQSCKMTRIKCGLCSRIHHFYFHTLLHLCGLFLGINISRQVALWTFFRRIQYKLLDFGKL